VEFQGDLLELGSEHSANWAELTARRGDDCVREFLAMLLREFDLPTWLWVGVGTTAGPEHCFGPRECLLNFDLREAGIIPAPVQVAECRVVARVAEDDRARLAVCTGNDQHRNSVINRSGRVLAIDDALVRGFATIHGEG